MPTIANADSTLKLQALDSDLAFVASQAAIELDNVLLGNETRLDAVRQLGVCLRDSTGGVAGPGSAEQQHLMDPRTIDVVSRAIDASVGGVATTISELTVQAWRLAEELRAAKTDDSGLQAERLRDFCVALSRVAVAQRQSLIEMEPSHPFRS